jgi:hypothetical protein
VIPPVDVAASKVLRSFCLVGLDRVGIRQRGWPRDTGQRELTGYSRRTGQRWSISSCMHGPWTLHRHTEGTVAAGSRVGWSDGIRYVFFARHDAPIAEPPDDQRLSARRGLVTVLGGTARSRTVQSMRPRLDLDR